MSESGNPRASTFSQDTTSSPDFLRRLVESGPGVIFRSHWRSRVVDYVSPNVEEIFGVGADVLIGDVENFYSHVVPEDRDRMQQKLSEAIERGDSTIVWEFRFRHGDGELRWFRAPTRITYEDGDAASLVGCAVDITGRKELERELRREHRWYEALLEASPAAIYSTEPSGDYDAVFVSSNVEKQTGHPPERFVREPSFWLDHVHPEDRPGVIRELSRIEERDHLVMEYRFLHADGDYRWMRDEARLIRNEAGDPMEIVGTWFDITDRKFAEERLRISQERLRQVTDHVEEIFWVNSATLDDVTYLSPAYEKIYGRPSEEAYGDSKAWVDPVHPEDRARFVRELEEIVDDPRPFDVEYRILRPDGDVRWLHARGYPIHDDDGEVVRFSGVTADVTERKRYQERLINSRKMQAVGRLAGGVAHHLNNLLTGVMGYVELSLEQLDEDDPRADDLREAYRLARKATDLTRDLLSFNRSGRGDPETADLVALTTETMGLIRHMVGSSVAVEFDADPDDTLHVRSSPAQIGEILINLASNAGEAMPDGGTLTIGLDAAVVEQERAVDSGLLTVGGYGVLSVTDDGVGMNRATRRQMFEPFYTTKDIHEHSGLGLTVVQGIVEQNDGGVEIESAPDAGTTVRVYLPMVDDRLV